MPAAFRTGVISCLFACLLLRGEVHGAGPFSTPLPAEVEWVRMEVPLEGGASVHEPRRAVAAVLTLTLGVFAAHRLYLGTDAKVPIIYGLTFGGFGVLVLIDLAHILFTKDLQAYCGNHKVFMWAGEKRGSTVPLTPP